MSERSKYEERAREAVRKCDEDLALALVERHARLCGRIPIAHEHSLAKSIAIAMSRVAREERDQTHAEVAKFCDELAKRLQIQVDFINESVAAFRSRPEPTP